ncbi:hypothetical protein RIF29_35887 [Crotalaria pallida]|uniref:Uncharacterized protein n=1 Tax=Crotalaria pallida TaxID=3830 RepID=A0AAN9HU13_CROPI
MQTLAERCSESSTEEDDLKDRSTKKAKPNEMEGQMDMIIEETISSPVQLEAPSKPLYREIAMSIDGFKPTPSEMIKMHVYQRSDEELAQIQQLLQKEKWHEVLQGEPPDQSKDEGKLLLNDKEHGSSDVLQKGANSSPSTC